MGNPYARFDDYGLRHWPSHFIDIEWWDELEAILTDLWFVEAKCAAGLVFDLLDDYQKAISAIPEAAVEALRESQRRAALETWANTIIECARVERLPTAAEIIRCVQVSRNDSNSTEESPGAQTVTRLHELTSLAGFVENECHPLLANGTRIGFLVQHAFNYAPSGPVHEMARRALPKVQAPLLLRRWGVGGDYEPKPALVKRLDGHENLITSVFVTPDSRLAISSSFRSMRIWDMNSGACRRVIWSASTEASFVCLAASIDSRCVLSGNLDGSLSIWDLDTGAHNRTLRGHDGPVKGVAISADGKHAVSASDDKTVRVWDLESGTCLHVLTGHAGQVGSISLAPDGHTAISASEDKTLRVWDLRTGKCFRMLRGHAAKVNSVDMSANGKWAVSGSSDETVRVWDLETFTCSRVLEGHTDSVQSVNLTPDGRRALSGSTDHTICVWDLERGACIATLEGHTSDVVSMTADGALAISGGVDQTVRVWDLRRIAAGPSPRAHEHGRVRQVCVTADGRTALSAGPGLAVRVWDLETGACVREMEGHTDAVESVSIAPNGRRAISGSSDKTIRVWDLETFTCSRVLEGHTGSVRSVNLAPDGRHAISAGGFDKTLRLWDLETGACLRVLEGHSGLLNSVCFTPDGRRAISGGDDRTMRLWDLETGECLQPLAGGFVTGVSATPDGRFAVSGSRDAAVSVWELGGYKCVQTLRGHRDGVNEVTVVADARHAVSASWDKTLRVWDMRTGSCCGLTFGDSSWETAVIAPASNVLVGGNDVGSLDVFDLCGFEWGPLVSTAGRSTRGRELAALCHWCGKVFPLSRKCTQAICQYDSMSDMATVALLPDAAFADDRLQVRCPHCAQLVRLNPFIQRETQRSRRQPTFWRRRAFGQLLKLSIGER